MCADRRNAAIQTWGVVEASKGFLVGRTEVGELSISAYALVRYLNKLPVTTSGQKGTTLAAALSIFF